MSFEKLGLREQIINNIRALSYKQPSPIQRLAIPIILDGKDVLASAQTGTGKTAAFTLPIVEKLAGMQHENSKAEVRAIILTPTRELASQVHTNLRDFSKGTGIRSAVISGGSSQGPQLEKLSKRPDVIVVTPGRLIDHVEKGTVDLKKVKFVVLDEADRMLDMGFVKEIEKILISMPQKKQTMMFSATFTEAVKKLASGYLVKGKKIQAEEANTTARKVSHVVHPVDAEQKASLTSYLIGSLNWKQVLIFTRTKQSADALSKEMTLDGIKNLVLHGEKSKGQRNKALAQFKDGSIRALIATDIASRGLDIEALPYVMNYELPSIPEDYIHRVGRTGRAGRAGHAVSLISEDDLFKLDGVEKLIRQDIKREYIKGYLPEDVSLFEADAKKLRIAKDRKYRKEAANKEYKKHYKSRDEAVKSTEKGMEHRRPRPGRAEMVLKTATRDGLKKGSKKKRSKRK